MAQEAFFWGANGQKLSPQQVAARRQIAAALATKSGAPKDVGEGLSRIGDALLYRAEMGRAGRAEEEGLARAQELFSGLKDGGNMDAIMAAMGDPWVAQSPGMSAVASALMGQHMQQQDPGWQLDQKIKQAQIDKLNADATTGNETFFGNIVPMQDENGNLVLGQASNRGRFQPMQGTEGLTPAPTTKQIDTGTEIITQDIYGNELFRTPKQNQQAAFDTAFGSSEGKATSEKIQALPSLLAKSDNMLGTIEGILNDPALENSTGLLSLLQSVPGTEQYAFGQRARQLEGQAFLQAFESLKGGGQITEVEGVKATQAIGRLSTAQSADDYRAALQELRGIIAAARERAVQSVQSITGGPQGQDTVYDAADFFKDLQP